MERKKLYIIVIVDVLILLLLLVASSTDFILKEPIAKTYKILVFMDTVTGEADENFKVGLNKGAVDWNMDLSLNYISDYEDTAEVLSLLEKEVDNGLAGLVLNCNDQDMAEAIVSGLPAGIPVVLWDMELESSRVQGTVCVDRETEINYMVEAILSETKENEGVALVERSGGSLRAHQIHETLAKKLTAQGIVVREIKMEGLSSTDTLVKGMAIQNKNSIVSADFEVLMALAKSCRDNQINVPLFGFGWELDARNDLEQGYIAGLVVHRSYEAGYFAVSEVSRLIEKIETNGETIFTQSVLVTPQNMYSPNFETYIFPYV